MADITITDHQRAVLKAAGYSANLTAWPVPARLGLGKGSATIVVKGLLKKGLVEERLALGADPVWRERKDGRPVTLVISKAGLAAIDMLPQAEAERGPAASVKEIRSHAAGRDTASIATPSGNMRTPRPGSKLAILVALLSRKEGATIEDLTAATGWQAHSVRGVMSGMLAKRFELSITSQKAQGRGRIYRSTGKPVEAET